MPQRIAASLALIAFALCLLVGMRAGNTFSTTVLRALLAMAATYAVGGVLGFMGQKMLEENLRIEERKLKDLRTEPQPNDR